MPKIVNPIGQKFGLLTVISSAGLTPCGHKKYNCICDCGNPIVRTGTSIRRSKNSSCGCFSIRGSLNKLWKGYGEISGEFWWSHIVRSANGTKNNNKVRKPKDLNISIKYAYDLFLNQNKKCALTGLELTFPKKPKGGYTASLDRVDSSIGYIEGNVQWVHKHVNIMKNKFGNQYFIDMCKLVSEKN